MRWLGNVSLAQRQWLGLVVLSSLGLALVSVLVYALTAWHLHCRQQQSLRNMTVLIAHLLQEPARMQSDGLFEARVFAKLREHFAGHADLQLDLYDAGGRQVFGSQHRLGSGPQAQLEFALEPPLAQREKWRGVLVQDSRADAQLLQHLALALSLSSFLAVLLLAFGGWVLVRRGVRPVLHLIAQTQALDASNLQQRLDASQQVAELQPLVQHFNQLLHRIEVAYRQLEGFNADVAHELNTPLSVLMTSTELALRRPRSAEAMQELLGSQLEELQRMAHMVQDMLFLAQVDRGVRARRVASPSLRGVLETVVEFHEAVFAEAQVAVCIEGDAACAVDLPLLKRAVSNLLGNASRFALPGSTVYLTLFRVDAETLRITVRNQGKTISPEELPLIFNRMYRADGARTAADGHHGLGLSIVAAVARMHGGLLFASSAAGWTELGFTLEA